MSPTQRSLKWLRDQGYPLVVIVERWNPFAKIRQDLFGFVDIVALKPGETLAVQCTSDSHVAERVAKIADHENVGAVRKAGWAIHVHGWTKGKRGDPRIVDCS